MNFRFNTKRGRPRRKPPSMHTPLIGSAGRIDDPPPLDSPDNGDILYLRPGHLERITVENDEIGYLAGRYRTPVVLLSVTIRKASMGVTAYSGPIGCPLRVMRFTAL